MYKYERFAKQHLDVVSQNGEEVNARCLFHADASPSFRFNVRKGKWYCHSCGAGGDADDLLQGQRAMSADLQSNLELLDSQIKGLKASSFSETARVTCLPETSLLRYRFPHPYWKNRGFDEDTIDWWDLGHDPISRRLTIPIRNEIGNLLGVIFRRLDDGRPKYMYPRGFARSKNLFGSWKQMHPSGTVCLVEGALDSCRVFQAGYPALAVYGSSVSDHQVRLLHRLGITKAVCFFDCDSAGRKAEAEARDRIKRVKLEAVQWPSGYEGRDPGGLTLPTICKLLDGHFDA